MIADLLAILNPAQREAVEHVDGPLLVLAGPGSGKTRVITHRIAYMVQRGIPPWSIAAVTFTNRAAREMVTRLQALMPGHTDHLTVGTFHNFCSRILRRDGHHIGVSRDFVIYDDGEQITIVRKALEELNLDDKRYPARSILSHISSAKSQLRSPREYGEFVSSHWEEVVYRVYRQYQELLEANQALDFDDLLLNVVQLFRQNEDVLRRYQDRYRYLLVDEFQDTNVVQYALVRLLGGQHGNVCVVGDEDQSIYSWRAADIRNILNFERDFPGCRTVVLEQNYRSTKKILTAAQSVIAANRLRKEKRLWTENDDGDPVLVNELRDEDHEAYYVVREVGRLIASERYQPRDVAVMFRTNAQSRVLEQRFLSERIPHRVIGVRFFERKEIKDILAYLRLIVNPADDISFSRIVNVPPRGIGAKTVAEIERWAARHGMSLLEAAERLGRGEVDDSPLTPRAERSLHQLATLFDELRQAAAQRDLVDLIRLILSSGYAEYLQSDRESAEDRQENVAELVNAAARFHGMAPGEGLRLFLEETALLSDSDEYDDDENAVTLITLHAAKGLEFPVVLITGVEEGLCPHSRSIDDPVQLEEERRLLYVGMTRAKERLYLTYAVRRGVYGEPITRAPSRFLMEIPSDVMRTPGLASSAPTASPTRNRLASQRMYDVAPAGPQPAAVRSIGEVVSRFEAGQRVRHNTFGEGIVVKSRIVNGDEEVEVAFQGVGLKRLSLAFAKLEPV